MSCSQRSIKFQTKSQFLALRLPQRKRDSQMAKETVSSNGATKTKAGRKAGPPAPAMPVSANEALAAAARALETREAKAQKVVSLDKFWQRVSKALTTAQGKGQAGATVALGGRIGSRLEDIKSHLASIGWSTEVATDGFGKSRLVITATPVQN